MWVYTSEIWLAHPAEIPEPRPWTAYLTYCAAGWCMILQEIGESDTENDSAVDKDDPDAVDFLLG